MSAVRTKEMAPTPGEIQQWFDRIMRLVIVILTMTMVILFTGQVFLRMLEMTDSKRANDVVVFLAMLPWVGVIGILSVFFGFFAKDSLDLNRDGKVNMEDIRAIPVFTRGAPTINKVEQRDLRHFIRRICAAGNWTQKGWRGQKMPSGVTCDNTYHKLMVDILADFGFIKGRGARRKGKLLERDAEVIINHLGLNGGDGLLADDHRIGRLGDRGYR